ncbi:MAG TPA: methyltransferase [Vicinamibacterales bacterium]|nr:methyltransferase [Vicinamibacterales bacterium]
MVDIQAWLAALEQRHLANLTRSELTRALRALSSVYVERREKLPGGAALDSAGKRAAFALFYGPMHFLTIDAVARALGANASSPEAILDLGCGTGVGGAAWALACHRPPRIRGIDRNAWAVAEANWTYNQLGLRGRAAIGDVLEDAASAKAPAPPILLAYAVNELPDRQRTALLERLADARARRSFLIVESIARRDKAWWPEWTDRLAGAGARADEWRFSANLPPAIAQIARSAGLDPRELTARTIYRA